LGDFLELLNEDAAIMGGSRAAGKLRPDNALQEDSGFWSAHCGESQFWRIRSAALFNVAVIGGCHRSIDVLLVVYQDCQFVDLR
jgi:hypothetical protein